ncbi:MAG: hypothetical protein AAGK14_06990 [Verrucomicrobiota bacterium]
MEFVYLASLAAIIMFLGLPVWVRFPLVCLLAGALLTAVGVWVMASYHFHMPVDSESGSVQYFYGMACAFGGLSLMAPASLMLAVRRYQKRLDHARAEDAAGRTPDLPAL